MLSILSVHGLASHYDTELDLSGDYVVFVLLSNGNDNRCARLTSSEQHEQFMAAMYPGDDPGDDPGEPQRIEPPSWDHPRITDWRYEVANGDTMRGFADWLANEDEPELGDQRLTDSHMRWEAEEGEPVAGHDDEYSVELVEPPGA